jgi:hypothetical protein
MNSSRGGSDGSELMGQKWGKPVENLKVSSADYDETNGVVTLEVYFEYQGDQDEDRVWHGNVDKLLSSGSPAHLCDIQM